MKLFVFESDKWVESDVIYPHDVVLCFQKEEGRIYLWEGPRATATNKKQARQALEHISQKYPQFSTIDVDNTTPQAIRSCIDNHINTRFAEIELIDRDPPYVMLYYTLLALLLGLGFGYFMIFRIIGWEKVLGSPWLTISEVKFTQWVAQNYVILIILASIFMVALVFAVFTQKIFLIVTAISGVLILTGTILYFRLGIFLFDFKPGAPLGYYYISIGAVILFFFLNIVALGIIITPMIISLRAIQKTTTPITWKEWKEKREKKVVEMKKFSILDIGSDFTEVEEEKTQDSD